MRAHELPVTAGNPWLGTLDLLSKLAWSELGLLPPPVPTSVDLLHSQDTPDLLKYLAVLLNAEAYTHYTQCICSPACCLVCINMCALLRKLHTQAMLFL